MSARLSVIQQRRTTLVMRAAAQRNQIGEIIQRWHGPISWVDRGVSLYRRAQPLFLAGGAAVLLWLTRHRGGAWLPRVLTVLQIASSLTRARANRH